VIRRRWRGIASHQVLVLFIACNYYVYVSSLI
jgi:hypothetical protein